MTGGKAELPILVKLIDAREALSVQVHPDDAYAAEHEGGAWGKTELWYVLRADPGAEIACGFSRDMDSGLVRRAVADGTICRYLDRVPVRRGDAFAIRPGTVHAIGAGIVMAEIQQSSDLTYRLYDYGRFDQDGKPRELHIAKALDVADLKSRGRPRREMRVLEYRRGCASELLARCRYFQAERLLIDTGIHGNPVRFRTSGGSFRALLCADGRGILSGAGVRIGFSAGDCVFVPAGSVELELRGKAELLDVGG